MSNKRLLEDVYGENKAARPWAEQPFDEEDYAYEIETQSVAERVFQMLFGGSNLFLQDDETVTYDKLELWELYRKAPTKQMRESLARQLGPMEDITVRLSAMAGQERQRIYKSTDNRVIRVPVVLMKTLARTKKLVRIIAQMIEPSLLTEVTRKFYPHELPVQSHYVTVEKWAGNDLQLWFTWNPEASFVRTIKWDFTRPS